MPALELRWLLVSSWVPPIIAATEPGTAFSEASAATWPESTVPRFKAADKFAILTQNQIHSTPKTRLVISRGIVSRENHGEAG